MGRPPFLMHIVAIIKYPVSLIKYLVARRAFSRSVSRQKELTFKSVPLMPANVKFLQEVERETRIENGPIEHSCVTEFKVI